MRPENVRGAGSRAKLSLSTGIRALVVVSVKNSPDTDTGGFSGPAARLLAGVRRAVDRSRPGRRSGGASTRARQERVALPTGSLQPFPGIQGVPVLRRDALAGRAGYQLAIGHPLGHLLPAPRRILPRGFEVAGVVRQETQ